MTSGWLNHLLQPLTKFYTEPNSKHVQTTKKQLNVTKKKEKKEICFGKGRKHCRKKRKCGLPLMFSKGYFLKVIKNQDSVVNKRTSCSNDINEILLKAI